ncbi:hypothetical protein EDWATA_01440 [Edwardsiella tarda ATCC 23685]|uniref:Uncharacterized protein n=1 Tax=Edwardsiella tarda ATCC 23685 TaxID=500638 RepID=D4F3X4_EDWTA|nr:hypothetical protein EDWATA_01440 [Edwardsiella tarda ATCC 23685]
MRRSSRYRLFHSGALRVEIYRVSELGASDAIDNVARKLSPRHKMAADIPA